MKRTKLMIVALAAFLALPAISLAATPQKVQVEVSGMSYSPAEVTVEKGVPVRMEFALADKPTCGSKVVFPELGIERQLVKGETTVVEFTPEKAGTLTFTCGMKMMKGNIVVRAN